jgi:hypothetical protein
MTMDAGEKVTMIENVSAALKYASDWKQEAFDAKVEAREALFAADENANAATLQGLVKALKLATDYDQKAFLMTVAYDALDKCRGTDMGSLVDQFRATLNLAGAVDAFMQARDAFKAL